MKSLPRALRWTLIGVLLSILSNDMFNGAFVPATLVFALPVWVIALRENIGVGLDFLSPVSGWLVSRFGAFTCLAGAEFAEGIMILSLGAWFLLGTPSPMLLVVLACFLLATGQVLDVATEVFEADVAGEDDDALVRYSGMVEVASSIVGVLLGRYLGSVLAIVDVPLMLVVSGVLSLAAAGTRLLVGKGVGSVEEEEDDLPRTDTSSLRVASLAPMDRFALLMSSLLLGLVPSLWVPYTIRSWGETRGETTMTFAYLASGIGALVASLVFLYFARRIGMRKLARFNLVSALLGLLLVPLSFPLAVVGFALVAAATSGYAQTVVTSRQLLLRGPVLATFTGHSRLAFAVGAAAGSIAGWLVSDYVGATLLPFLAAAALLPALWGARALPKAATARV